MLAQDEKVATNVQSVLEMLQRSEISNPPAYGAKIVATVLEDDNLRNMWYEDLKTMSRRIQSMRQALYKHLTEAGKISRQLYYFENKLELTIGAPGTWDHLIQQSGMFGFLGLSFQMVSRLKGKFSENETSHNQPFHANIWSRAT